jgi:aspartate-semialdehyde dehydrogenase
VVDLTHTLAETADVPLIVPEVNPEAVAEAAERGLIACPIPNATALAIVLKPLDVVAALKRVSVTSFEPVSSAGRAGVDELVQQTRDLLSGTSPDIAVFPQRIAFNLIPQVGDFVSGGRTRGEWLLESQTRRLLELPDLPITVTSVYVPVFFGQACDVRIETERPLDADAARALLRQAPGLLVAETEDGYPTLADVIGSEATHVGRVRDDPTVPFGLASWIAIDGLRKGTAVNAVQIAELALRERG